MSGNYGAPAQPSESYRGLDGFLKALDLSLHPTDNSDRGKKLGMFKQTSLAIVVEVTEKGAAKTADGFMVKGTKLSHYPIEPDIVNLRSHGRVKRDLSGTSSEKMGMKTPADEVEDKVYDFGLIADHQNPNWKKAHRGTILKDQSSRQRWGFLGDALTLTDIGSDLADAEMMLTSAGFPWDLYPSKLGGRSTKRNGVAFHISRNAGLVADRQKVGSFNHIFCWLGGPSGSGAFGNVPSQEDELGIRGDAGTKLAGGQIVVLEHNEPPTLEQADGLYFQVLTYGDVPGPKEIAGLDLGLDQNSNQKKIEKKVPKRPLRGFVRLKKYYELSKHPH